MKFRRRNCVVLGRWWASEERQSARNSMYERTLNSTLVLTGVLCRRSWRCCVAGTRTSPAVCCLLGSCHQFYSLERPLPAAAISRSLPYITKLSRRPPLVLHLHIHCVHNTAPENSIARTVASPILVQVLSCVQRIKLSAACWQPSAVLEAEGTPEYWVDVFFYCRSLNNIIISEVKSCKANHIRMQ